MNTKPIAEQCKSTVEWFFDKLAAVKFAVSVVILLAIACVAGTLLPQGADVARYVERHPESVQRMELLGTLGLTHIFYAWWFIGLLCMLASSVATCSSRRFAMMLHTSGTAWRRAFGSMITHVSILLILAGGVIRGVWGERGNMELREGQTIAAFQMERGEVALPFSLQLEKFEIETYDPSPAAGGDAKGDGSNQLVVQWPERRVTVELPIEVGIEQVLAPKGETPNAQNSFRIKILKYVPDFTVDLKTREVASRSEVPRNPAILVAVNGPNYENNRWLFAKFPDFNFHAKDEHATGPSPLQMVYQNEAAKAEERMPSGPIKSFKSTVKVIDGGSVTETRAIEVNRPFSYKGYTLYQTGYNPRDLSWTAFQVVSDPGVPVVYAGFVLMILGLFISFYLNPWLESRRRDAGATI